MILFYYTFYFLDGGRKFGPPRDNSYGTNLMAQNTNNPIPLCDDLNHQSSRAAQTENRPSASHDDPIFASGRRERPGRGGARPNIKAPGERDPYGIDIAPLNVFENQVIPVGVHNLSKSFRPNMATIRVLSLGTKFIPKWKDANIKQTFRKFGDLKSRLQNGMFFVGTTPGTFVINK